MKKLVYLGIGALWLLILTFVIIQWVGSPSKDQYQAAMGYANLLKDYNDNKQISADQIEEIGINTKFTHITAKFFSDLQKIEMPQNDKYNNILAAKDASSLLNAEASTRNKGLAQAFVAELADNNNKKEALYNQYAVDIKALPIKGLIFPVEPVIKSIKDKLPERQEYTNNLIAVTSYVKYIIDFVDSRRGGNYFTSDGQKITFTSPEDQKYYEELVRQLNDKKSKVDKYRGNKKSNIDAAVNQLSAQLNRK